MDSVGDQSSSRKDKSLGLVVTRFVEVYDRDEVDLIEIDQAAKRLGVKKPRIYNILNHFSSIGLVEKSGKGQYVWKGFGAIYPVLSALKDEGMKENFVTVPDATKEIDEGMMHVGHPKSDFGRK